MKLHLPKLLRNAVLACITAVAGIATTTVGTATFAGGVVAFAISQQQAQAANELNVPTGGNFFGGNFEFDFVIADGYLSGNNTSDVVAYYGGDRLTGDYGANAYAVIRDGESLTLKVGRGKLTGSTDALVAGMEFVDADSYTFARSLEAGTVYTVKVTGGDQNQVVALFEKGAEEALETMASGYKGNMNGGGAGTTMNSELNVVYSTSSVYWNGKDGNASVADASNWISATGSVPATLENANLVFSNLISDITQTVTLSNITLSKVYVLADCPCTFDVSGNVEINNSFFYNNPDFNIAENAVLKFVNTTVDITHSRPMDGAGKVQVGAGAVLSVNHSSQWSSVRSAIEVLGGGTLKLTQDDSMGWGAAGTERMGDVLLRGDSESSVAKMQVTEKQTMKTNVTLGGNALVTGGQLEFFGGKITATGTNNTIESEIYSRSTQLDDGTIHEIEVTNAADTLNMVGRVHASGGAGNNAIAKKGAGTLTFSGANNILYKGFYAEGGIVNFNNTTRVQGGALTVSEGATVNVNSALTITHAISNSGSITVEQGGSIILDDALVGQTQQEGYVNGAFETSENGFRGAASVTVMSGSVIPGLAFTYAGREYTPASDGSISNVIDFKTLHVVTGTAYMGGDQDTIKSTHADTIAMSGGNLVVADDCTAGNVNFTVDGATLDATDGSLLVTGSVVAEALNTTMKGNITINGNDQANRGLRLTGTSEYDEANGTITTPNLIITGEDTVVSTYRLNLGDDGGDAGSKETRLDITAGAVVNVNGTSWNGNNQDSFLLAHWSDARGEVNIENATLNILNSGFTVVDNAAKSAVLNIKDRGILNISALSRKGSSKDKVTVRLEAGGTINIGSYGIGRHAVDGTGNNGDFNFNINGGKLGILSSADSWATYKALELNGDLTINTEKYDAVAEKYTGGAGLITLNGVVTSSEHSLIKDGVGTLALGAEVMKDSNLVVNKGIITLAAGATSLKIGSLSMTDGVIGVIRLNAGQTLTLGAAPTGDICFVLDGITFEEGVNTKQITVADGDYKPATAVVECLTAENVSATYADGIVTLTKSDTPLAAGDLKWNADGITDDWTSGATFQNWTVNGVSTRFVDGSTVTFGDDSSSTGEIVTITGTVATGGVTVNGTGWVFDGSGNIGTAVEVGNDKSGGVSNTGKLTLAENASATFRANAAFDQIEFGTGSTLIVENAATVQYQTQATQNAAIAARTISLDNASLSLHPRGDEQSITIDTLKIAGESTLETVTNNSAYQMAFDVKNLTSDNKSAVLHLKSGSKTGKTTTFNLEGTGEYVGDIKLTANAQDGRRVALNLNSANVAKNAVITYVQQNGTDDHIAIGLGTDATVRGIAGTMSNTIGRICAYTLDKNTQSFDKAEDNITTARTLTIATREGDAHSTNASLGYKLNLVKTGAGSQSFTGDLSVFNGTMTVSGGTLSVSSIGAATAMSITSAGATLAVADTAGVVLGSGKSLSAVNGAVLDAALTLSGGALTLGTSDTAWAAGSGLSLNNQVLTLDSTNKTALSMNLSSELKTSGGEVVLFTDVMLDTQLVENATLGTYFKELSGSLANAVLTYSGNKLLATINASDPLYWIKGQGTWSVGSELDKDGIEGGETQAFANGDKVTFGQLASDATVTISGTTAAPLTAGAVTVDAGTGKTYTFAVGSGEGVNGQLTTSSLTVTSGTAKFNNGSLNFGALETITVNGVLDIQGLGFNADLMKKLQIATGTGEVQIAGGWCVINDLTALEYNADINVNGTLEILRQNGSMDWTVGKKIITSGDVKVGRHVNLIVDEDGSIVAPGAIKLGNSNQGTGTVGSALSLLEGGSIKADSIIRGDDNDGTGTKLNTNTFTMEDGVLELTGTRGIESYIATTITGGTLQTGDNSWSITGTNETAVNIGGATIANIQVDNTETTDVADDTRAGTGVITLDTVNLTSGLTVTGKVQFKGAITLAKGYTPTATKASHYVKADGTTSTSGYKVVDDVYSLSALGEDGAKLSTGTMTEFQDTNTEAPDTTWSVVVTENGADKTINGGVFNGTDKTVTFAGQRTTEYWVCADTDTTTADVVYASTNTTEFGNATALVLDGGTLQLTTSLGGALVGEGGSGIKLNSSGTINIYDADLADTAQVVLQASQISRVTGNTTATATLTGNGVYDLGSVSNLGSNVADTLKVVLSDSWTGTVKLAGTIGGLNLNSLASASSVVELAGVSGWLPLNSTISRALHLSGDGFTLNDSSNGTYTMSGAISGTGNLTIEIPNTNTDIALTGNLEKWSGGVKLVQHTTSENTPNLTLSLTGGGNMFAQTNNGIEMDRGGVMNVTIGNTTTATTMRGTITNKGAGTLNLTIQGDTDLDAAVSNTGTGTLNLTNNGTLDVDAATTVSSLTNAGTLNLNAATTVSSLTNNAEKTATVAAGTTLKAVTVTNAGTMTVNGTLAVDDAVASNVLAVTNSGTLSLANDTTLGTLSNSGTLTATGKTLTVTGGITGVTTGTGESATTAYGSIEAGALTLQAASNTVSTLTLTGALTLGKADAASALTVNGAMSVAEVQVNNLGNAISAASLTSTALNISITEALLTNLLGTQDKTMTLLTLTGENATLDTSILSVNDYAYGTLGSSENGQFTYELCVSADGKALTLVTALAGTEWNEATGTRWNAAGLQDADFIDAEEAASGFAEAVTKDTSVVIELSNEAMPQDFIVVNGAVEANNLTVDRWGVEHGDFTISAGEDTFNAVADSITVYQDMFVNGNRNLIVGDAVAADGAEGLAVNVHHNLTINESAGLIVAANAALTVGVADDPETEVDETAAGKLTVNGKFSNVGDVDVNGDVTIAENAYLYSGVMALTGAPFGDRPSSIDITGKVTNKGNLINYALGNVTIGAEGTPADTTSLVNTGSVVVNGGTVTINGSMDNAEAGSLTVGSAEMAVTGALDNTSGSIAIGSAAVADDPATEDTNESAAATYGTLTVGGKLDNTSGSISIAEGSSLSVGGALDNTSGGRISIAEGSSLTVGTTSATADLTNGGGTLDITGGTLAVSGALNNTATVDGQTTGGSITIDENATVTVGGALNNTSGSINIDGGSSLTVGGALDNTSGSITIGTAAIEDDPATDADETKAATTGSLTVNGNLVNYGGGSLTVQGEGSTVEVTGDLALSELTTDASGNEVVATTGSLTVGEGTELTVGGDLVANEMELAFGGNVTVGETATIGELTNDGTLTAKNANIGTLHNNGGLFVQAELLPDKDSEGNDQYDGGNLTIGLLDGSGDVTVSEGGTLSIANSADFTGKLTNYGKIVMTPVVDDEGNETTPSFTISESTEQGGNIEAPVLVIGGQMKDVVDEAGNVVIDPDTQEAVKEYESASGTVLGEVVTDEIRFDNMELVVQDHPTDSTQKIEAPILTMTSIASTAEGTDAEGNPNQKDIALHFTQLESAEGVTSLVQDLSTWFEPDTEGNVRETVTITLLAVKEIAENVSGFVLAADYAEHEEFAEYYQQLLSAGYKLSNLKDPLNPEVVTFALRNTPEYQEVTIDVQKQTVDDATWTVENDKLTTSAGLVIGTMTDGTVKLLKNSILDNVQSVEVKQNIAIDLTGNAPDEEVDDQGNLVKPVEVNIHGLKGDKNLTIRGENTDADVVNIDVDSDGYSGQLVLNKVNATVQGSAANKPAEVRGGIRLTTDTLADLNVTNTVVDATDGGVVLKGNMEDGSLKLDIGEKLAFQSGSKAPLAAASSLKLDGTGLDIAYNDKGATTMDMTGVSKTGQVLVNMSKMTGSAGDIVIGKDGVQSALLDKYFSGIRFDANKNAVVADRNTSYYSDLVSDAEVTSNGMAGMALADAALLNLNPQVEMQGSGLATMLDAIEKAAADGGTDELDHLGAALAGASSAVLGMAAHGDLDRQLQAIRNRTTTMGVDQSVVHPEIPYFNAWINAEGDYRELSDNGTEGGYKLSSWGGTVGFDVDCSPTVTAGLAFTAMYGDLTVTGADDAHGDFDTYYLSAFARYCASAWTHTFVATLGTTDFAMERTVMNSKQEYTTSGTSFGLMYELGRVYALDEDATSCIQPVFNITWRHTSVDGYQEDGNDLALEVDSQTLNTVTLGLGARVQAIVGENMYNRASIFECRLFAKADIGDRRSSTEVNLAGGTAEIESAEVGALGLEAGAGLTIPLGDGGSSLFMDASVELRADYTNVNGTVGYRVNF